MPKIRGIKPDFWTDEEMVELSVAARLLFIGLWSYACDNGHLQDKPRQIKMRIFPGDEVNAAELLRELEASGRIERGDGWISIPHLTEHQKPDRRYFTTCDKEGCEDPPEKVSQRESRRAHGVHTAGARRVHDVGTVGARVDGDGEGEVKVKGDDNTPRDGEDIARDFEAWYAAYPRKEARGQAVKAYRAARKKTDAEMLLDAIRRHAPVMLAGEARFIPLPASWLNGERWLDQPLSADPTPSSGGHFQPFQPGPPPSDIEDDATAVAEWLEVKRAEHLARSAR